MKKKTLDILIGKYKNETSLENTNNINVFPFLCLSLLSHRTRDEIINKLVNYFISIKTPKELLEKSFLEVRNNIKIVNFNYKKTKILFFVARYIQNNFFSTPIEFNILIQIPYIGNKTASLVNTQFSSQTKHITIDTHVERFISRFFKEKGNYIKHSNMIKSNTSKTNWKNISDVIIGFAKNICTNKNPKCTVCVLGNKCNYKKTKFLS